MAFEPTPEQQQLLGHDPHRHGVILAGPGTGKSATMVAYIEHLSTTAEAPRVRLLTFTRAATAELALKVSAHPTLAAMRPSTVHSFAISVLTRNPGAASFPTPLRLADEWEHDEIVRQTLARRAGVTLKILRVLMREQEANWQSLVPEDDPNIPLAVRASYLGAWDEHRRVFGYTMLSELPNLLRDALANHDGLNGLDYDLLIVDEYQDLNACDLEILSRLAVRGCAILGAGDDDQSIYGFRKAAPEGIRRFSTEYAPSERYTLSIAKRCARRIIEWSQFVIQGDPGRPPRPSLTPDDGSEAGEVALLTFATNEAEARGIAELVQQLIDRDGVPPDEILVLVRGDHSGHFSGPIKEHLASRDIAVSDTELVERALELTDNRRSLELLRLASNPQDSLAWAALMHLTPGVGSAFFDHIYATALPGQRTFATALLQQFEEGFPDAPRGAASKAAQTITRTREWLDYHPVPVESGQQWGQWVTALPKGPVFPGFDDDLTAIIRALDAIVEPGDLSRFLNQIAPLGRDLAAAKSQGVRIMTMGASKGLTVRATIVAGVEEGIVPRPDCELAEERRLLYVAMTRSRKFLFLTWCQRRTGPTARSGSANVGLRTHSAFLRNGPVSSQNGATWLTGRHS